MRIEKLEINGFGRFSNRSFDLIPGINVLYGSNESGKSTLQGFIKAMLYYSTSQKNNKATFDSCKKYKPWTGTVFSGNIEYCLDNGDKYRIERNFELNTVKVYDSFFNDITTSFDLNKSKNIGFTQKHIGLNETCFEKTVYIRQMASAIDEFGMKELHTKLLNIYQTGSEEHSFKMAENALFDALKKHVGTEKTSIRPMDKVNSRLKELRSELSTLLKKREFTVGLERELHSSLKKIEILNTQNEAISIASSILDAKKELEKQYVIKNQFLEIIKNFEENENDRLQKLIEEKKTSLSEEEFILSSLSAFNYLEKGADIEMLELNKKVDNLKKQINNIIKENPFDEVNAPKSLLNTVMIALSLSLSAVITVFGFVFNPLLFLGLILTVGLLGFGIISRLSKRKHLSGHDFANSNGENHKLLVNEVNELEKRIDELLSISKTSSVEEFLKMYSLYNSKVLIFTELNDNINLMEEKLASNQNNLSLKSHINKIDNAINALDISYEKCVKNYIDFCSTNKIAIENRNLSIVNFIHLNNQDMESYIEDIKKENIDSANNLKIKIKEFEVLIENSVGNDSIQNIEEEIISLENKKKELESLDFSIRTALATLSEASLEIQRDYVPLLNKNAGYYLSKISGNKYDRMLMDENFTIKVLAPDLNQIIPGKLLSNGTVDQLYFALRLAASDMLTKYGESLPLILDEVFSQYDSQRTIETTKLLWELSEQRQIILFTCKDREVEVIKNVCNINTINIIELG